MSNSDVNYWLVGATWGGVEEKYHDFISNGYWESGYSKGEQPAYDEKIGQMRVGDRIAIKRALGPSDSDIVIRAIGIISEVDEYAGRIYVRWMIRGLNRRVESKGAYKTVHGPYQFGGESMSWISRVFSI